MSTKVTAVDLLHTNNTTAACRLGVDVETGGFVAKRSTAFVLAASFLASIFVLGLGDSSAANIDNIDLSSGSASFFSVGPALEGGDDVLTFVNLAAGTYDFVLTLSGQAMTLTSATLNGVAGMILGNGDIVFAWISGQATSPLTLVLTGTASSSAMYSGELRTTAVATTAVPEPATLLLMLAGLAMVSAAARQRQTA
jgi:hypothetical protein